MSKIVLAVEPWERVRLEVWPLWAEHHAEIARDGDLVPLAPDWEKYSAHAAAGALHIVTARQDGRLVGYLFALVSTHLHYATTQFAFFDLYWLHPDHRLAGDADSLETLDSVGAQLFIEAEETLRRRGVEKMIGTTKVWQDNSRLFKLLDWEETERVFARWIGQKAATDGN